MDTQGLTVSFGKHKGELFTRVPISYLRWMINNNSRQADIAKAEFERRGDTLPKVELSGHAIDNASCRVLHVWQDTCEKNEGIYSWLQRMTLEALEENNEIREGVFIYCGMKLVIASGEEFPVLKTIMREKIFIPIGTD